MLQVGQAPRAEPLTPSAVLGLGPSALSLGSRLLELSDAHLQRLRGVAGEQLLLVLGAAEDLPWSDGVIYLGREPDAPELLLPCALAAEVPAPLLSRALSAHVAAAGIGPPLAVSLEPPLVVSTEAAQQLSREALAAWRQGQAE
jgi:hypothetical protein